MRNQLVKAIKWALLVAAIALGLSLILLFPAGMIAWVFYPEGWKIALAGSPFTLTALVYANKMKNGL